MAVEYPFLEIKCLKTFRNASVNKSVAKSIWIAVEAKQTKITM